MQPLHFRFVKNLPFRTRYKDRFRAGIALKCILDLPQMQESFAEGDLQRRILVEEITRKE